MPSDLTIDLLSAQELIANGNDSTPSALNLTAHGAVTFGANGATFPDVGNAGLQRASGYPDFSLDNLFIMFQAIRDFSANNQNALLGMSDAGDAVDQFYLAITPDGDPATGSVTTQCSGSDNLPSTPGLTGPVTNNVRSTIAFWADKTNGVYGLQVDNGTIYTTPLVAGLPSLVPYLTLGNVATLNFGSQGVVRYLYIWFGADAVKSADDRTWLYNSGAGRTYAEILATHGTPSSSSDIVPPAPVGRSIISG